MDDQTPPKRRKTLSSWASLAACAGYDTNLWFPETPQGRDYFAKARQICAECEVRADCLEFALDFDQDNDRFGMFGGKSPKERAKIRDERMRPRPVIIPNDTKVAVRPAYAYKYAMLAKIEILPEHIATRRTKIDMKNTDIPSKTRLVMQQTPAAPASTLTAQAAAAMIMAGWEDPLDAKTCAALFMGASYVLELARQGGLNGTLTPNESAAAQGVAELAMQVWKHHAESSRENNVA